MDHRYVLHWKGFAWFTINAFISVIASMFFFVHEYPGIVFTLPIVASTVVYFIGTDMLDEFQKYKKTIKLEEVRFFWLLYIGGHEKEIPLQSYKFQIAAIFLYPFGLFLGGLVLLINNIFHLNTVWSLKSPSPLFIIICAYTVVIIVFSIIIRFLYYFIERKSQKSGK